MARNLQRGLPFQLAQNPGAGYFSPLNFYPGEFHRDCTNELVTVLAGNAVDILNISPGVPGYVDYIHWDIQFAVGGIQTTNNSLLRVFVDGETTPSIVTDMAGLLSNVGAAAGKWSIKRLTFENVVATGSTAGGASWTWRYPIPFKSSIHIQLVVSADGPINFWSDVGYRIGINHLGYKLFSSNQTIAFGIANGISPGTVLTDGAMTNGSATITSASSTFTAGIVGQRFVVANLNGTPAGVQPGGLANGGFLYTTVNTFNSATSVTLNATNVSGSNLTGLTGVWGPNPQGNGSTVFLNLPSGQGNQGVAVYHSITTATAPAADTYLENNLVWYLDGQTPLANGVGPGVGPQVDTNGTEDYFTSGFYFTAGASAPYMQNDFMAVSHKLVGGVSCAVDLWELHGGIPWNDGVLCRWETGQRASPGLSTTTVGLGWTILYYQPYL